MGRSGLRGLAMLVVVVGCLAVPAAAQGVGLDDTFGTEGTVFTPLSVDSDRYLAAARAPGGGTYNVGYTTMSGTDRAFALTRVDANGVLDTSFAGGAGVAIANVVTGPFAAPPAGTAPNGSAEIARGVAVQSDGKIVVAGQAETPPGIGKPDSRDTDVYVARFESNGTLDGGFGVGGVARVDLSNGVAAGNTVNGDQAYGLILRPGGQIVVIGAKGTDSATPAKTDRDLALVQLSSTGVPDPGFGVGGVAVSPQPGVQENPRQGLVDAAGRVVAVSYGPGIGGQVRPFLHRFLPGGTPDPAFGVGGIATGEVGGPSPGFAEAYDVAEQGDGYVVTGYGTRSTTPAAGIDAVVFRFSAGGSWDQTFGDGGLTTYDRVGGADRGRDLSLLADGRIVVVGSSATAGPTPVLEGMILIVNPDGWINSAVGSGGAYLVDLGGPNDSFFGSTAVSNGTKVVAAGYRGGSSSAADEAALARIDPPPFVARPSGPGTGPDIKESPLSPPPVGKPKLARVTKTIKPKGTAKVAVSCTARCRLKVTLRIGKKSSALPLRTIARTGRIVVTLKIPKKLRRAIAAARRSKPGIAVSLRVQVIQGDRSAKPITIKVTR